MIACPSISSLLVSPPGPVHQLSASRLQARQFEVTMDAFTQELPRRVQNARRDPIQLKLALYVYCRRLQLGMSRSQLAELSGIDPAQVAFIENGLMLAGEPTQEDISRLEPVLGISYDAFMAHKANRRLIAQVKQYKFGHGRLSSARDWLLHLLAKLRPHALTVVCS